MRLFPGFGHYRLVASQQILIFWIQQMVTYEELDLIRYSGHQKRVYCTQEVSNGTTNVQPGIQAGSGTAIVR
jgi:hypothetical protein